MKFGDIFTFLVPKNNQFFRHFAEDSANLVEMARTFNQMIQTPDPAKRQELIRKVEELENKGDEITHKIFIELGKNFITPIDREDIHTLATALDDIADYMHGTASRINLYKVQDFSLAMQNLADVIEKSVTEIDVAIRAMEGMKNEIRVREAIVRINSLENHADDIFDEAIARLFHEQKDAIALIKEKEILANMETATDKCEDVANIIESILVKNS